MGLDHLDKGRQGLDLEEDRVALERGGTTHGDREDGVDKDGGVAVRTGPSIAELTAVQQTSPQQLPPLKAQEITLRIITKTVMLKNSKMSSDALHNIVYCKHTTIV